MPVMNALLSLNARSASPKVTCRVAFLNTSIRFKTYPTLSSLVGPAIGMACQLNSALATSTVPVVIPNGVIAMPLADLLDLEQELARLVREGKRLAGEVGRVEGKLGNEGFLAKAPAQVVAEEREKLAKYRDMLAAVGEQEAQIRKQMG